MTRSLYNAVLDAVICVRAAALDFYGPHVGNVVMAGACAVGAGAMANLVSNGRIEPLLQPIIFWSLTAAGALILAGMLFALFYPKPTLEHLLCAKFLQRIAHAYSFGLGQLTRLDSSGQTELAAPAIMGMGSYSVYGTTYYAPPAAFLLNTAQAAAVAHVLAFCALGTALGGVNAWQSTAGGGDAGVWFCIFMGVLVVAIAVGILCLVTLPWVLATFMLGMGATAWLLSWTPVCWHLRRGFWVPASIAEQYVKQNEEQRSACPWGQWIERPVRFVEVIPRGVGAVLVVVVATVLAQHVGWISMGLPELWAWVQSLSVFLILGGVGLVAWFLSSDTATPPR